MKFGSTAILIAAFLLGFAWVVAHAEEMTADEWFRLVVELHGQNTNLDAEERLFVRNMINVLALSDDRMPKAHQQEWLLHIRDRVLLHKAQPQ